jgi:pimeloyl-ACP methyl ester carboxylesterase
MRDHSISTIGIGDCRIRLMRGGAGAPLVFFHGSGGIGIWLPSMGRLAKKFDVIAPEHPGFGESDTPVWLDTIGDLANFYLDFSIGSTCAACTSSAVRSAAGSPRILRSAMRLA